MVFSLAKLSVPVSAQSQTRVYVEMPPEGYINGTEIGQGNIFTVDVYIENATDLNQWALSVQVDPNVLEVMGALDGAGTVIYDYVESINWEPGDVFAVASVNTTEGKMVDITHMILAWDELYPTPGGFNGSGKLCTLGFKVLSETDYSPIHLYNVKLYDGLYWETGTPHWLPPDIVEDGHYNPPPPPADIAVINVVPSESQGYPTWTTYGIDINVTVLNNGTQTINCTVAAYYNASTWYEIGTQNVTDLAEGANTTLTFNWNLSGVAYGVYTIKANATLASDTYPDNNEKVNGQVKVKIVGDVDGNNYVGSWDLILLAVAYGSNPEDPNWNRQADFDDNAYVGPDDLSLFGAFYGESI
jgi:hypothetical protein